MGKIMTNKYLCRPRVLMYHAVVQAKNDSASGRPTGAGVYDVYWPDFQAHMATLQTQALVVGLLPTKPSMGHPVDVVLTFDDGEMNNFTYAVPLLRQLNFPAYFFVIVERVGTPGYMGWRELLHLVSAGMVVGSHGLTHRMLTTLNSVEMERELRESKRILEENLHVPVNDFSVPRGFYDKEVLSAARRVGYQNIFVSDLEPGTSGECHPRIAVKSHWTAARFQLALAGQTPWLEYCAVTGSQVLKRLLGPLGYDKFRSRFLRVLRKG